LKWLAEHVREASARIERGQAEIAARFTPRVVAQVWKAAILRALDRA